MNDFYKYHGLGNDFVVVEHADRTLEEDWVREVCDRRRGVGADGILVVAPSRRPDSDGTMVLYNRDGTRPEMCGNGIRCVARHLVDHQGIDPDAPMQIDTDAGPRTCRITDRNDDCWRVSVDMGRARFDDEPVDWRDDDRRRQFWAVDMGNPHAVTFGTASEELADRFGPAMNAPGVSRFPEGVNVEFAAVRDEQTLEVVVYERGVGRTQACGTGACASAVAGWRTGRLAEGTAATIRLPGGELEIREDDNNKVWMAGPVVEVFFGTFPERLACKHGSMR